VTKKAGEKKKARGKKLGQIVARKRHALTAMRWREIVMERGMKKARDTKKTKSESENMGHSQIQQCVGERLDRETKKASEKKQSDKQKYGALTNTAMCWGEAGQGDKKGG